MTAKTVLLKSYGIKRDVISNILFIAPLPPPTTGQSIACQLLCKYLSKNNNIFLVNLSKRGFVQGVSSIGRIFEIFDIIRGVLLKVWRSDVIYFTNSESIAGNLKDLLIYTICWIRLNRMVVHLHGGAGMRVLMSDKHLFLRAVNSFFIKRVGAVVVLGDRLKGIYSDVVPAERLYAVPNFANEEFFVSYDSIEEKFKSTTVLNLLFLSNLLPGKGHLELLFALSQLPLEQRLRLKVDFAGGFESLEIESNFRQQAQAVQGLNVHVHGVVHGEKKRMLLDNAHLFCLPTYYPYEGQPISILEAYASGCAVITTNHSGIFDTFTPGVNGLEVLPRKPDSIKEVLVEALANPQQLYKFAKQNRHHAELNYRESTHLNALEKVIFTVKKPHL